MKSSDLENPKVRAYLINAIVNGLITDIKTIEERRTFCSALIEFMASAGPEAAFLTGDEDGLLIEDVHGDMIGVINVFDGKIKFQQIMSIQEMDKKYKDIFARTVLTTIGFAAAWHDDKPEIVQPIGGLGLQHGGEEKKITFNNDDGFGIT